MSLVHSRLYLTRKSHVYLRYNTTSEVRTIAKCRGIFSQEPTGLGGLTHAHSHSSNYGRMVL